MSEFGLAELFADRSSPGLKRASLYEARHRKRNRNIENFPLRSDTMRAISSNGPSIGGAIQLRRFLLPIALVFVDLFALNASFVTALYLRFHDYNFSSWAPSFLYSYTYLLIAVNLIHLVLLLYFKEAQFPRRFKPTYVLPRIGRIVLITLLASVLIIFLSKGLSRSHQVFHFSRPTLIAFWILSFFYLSTGRFLFGIWQLWLFDRGMMQRPVVVIGEGRLRDDLETRIKFNRWFGARVVETVTVAVEAGKASVRGSGSALEPGGLREYLRGQRVSEVFLATNPDDFAQIFAVLDTCRAEHVKVRMVPDHLQLLISHLLLSESVAVPNRTKEDLIYEVYQVVDSHFALDLATIAILGSKGIPPTFGGIEHHVSHLAHRLARQGFRIKVYARSYYTQLEGRYQGLEIIRLPSVYTKHLDAISHTALATMHMMLQPVDVAHYHAQGPSIFALLPRLFGIRTVTTVHGLDWKREKWGAFATRCLQLGEYASARFPTRTVAVSRTLKSYYEKQYGRSVHYVPNGIDLKELPGSNEIRDKYDLEPHEYLLFVGRLVPEKGCHYLIEAFRRIETDKKLVIAGGSSHSDEYFEMLRELAGDDPRIVFPGYVYGEALDELYTHAYLYLQPSDLEGLSIALLEALSFGAAVLASDIPENLEVLSEENTPPEKWYARTSGEGPPVGFVHRKGDIAHLKEMIESLLEDPAAVDVMRTKGRAWLRERYDWDRIADETAVIYREIASK